MSTAKSEKVILVIDLDSRRIKGVVVCVKEATVTQLHKKCVEFDDEGRVGGMAKQMHKCVPKEKSFQDKTAFISPNSVLRAVDELLQDLCESLGSEIRRIEAIALIGTVDDLHPFPLDPCHRTIVYNLDPKQALAQQFDLPFTAAVQSQRRMQSTGMRQTTYSELCVALNALSNLYTSKFAAHRPLILTPLTFLRSVFVGQILQINILEAAATNMCTLHSPMHAEWIDSQGSTLYGKIAPFHNDMQMYAVGDWLKRRFGFVETCIVCDCIPSSLSALLSFSPGKGDAILGFGHSDEALIPVPLHMGTTKHKKLPNPFLHLRSDQSEQNAPYYLSVRQLDAGDARSIIRDVYTKNWHAFGQLVNAVAIGGTVGLDDKLYLFHVPEGLLKGLRRYEHGTRVSEFSDLRSNARCLVEGQALQLRRAYAEITQQALALERRGCESEEMESQYRGAASCLSFPPLDTALRPTKWWFHGAATATQSLVDIFCEVLGGTVMLPSETSLSRPIVGAGLVAAYFLDRMDRIARGHTLYGYDSFLHEFHSQEDVQKAGSIQKDWGMFHTDLTPRVSARRLTNVTPSLSPVHELGQDRRMRSSSLAAGSEYKATPARFPSSSPFPSPTSTIPTDVEAEETFCVPYVPGVPRMITSQEPSVCADRSVGSKRSQFPFGMIEGPTSDDDIWQFYGAMLEEHIRLFDSIEKMTHRLR